MQRMRWTTRVSSSARHGLFCVWASAHLQQIARSLVNGSTAGSSTRPPLLNTSSGRPWFWASRVPPNKLTSRILERDQVTYCGCPTGREHRVEPESFRTLVLERLQTKLNVTDAVCEDLLGRHRVACPRSGVAHKNSTNGTDVP